MVHKLRTPDGRIAALAEEQHGVVTATQLARLGLSRGAVAKRSRGGRLHRLHRGVYAVGHGAVGTAGILHAAVLATGDGAALSHRSAAIQWGLLGGDPRDARRSVDVITSRRPDRQRGIRLHYTRRLPGSDVTARCGIPTTTATRTLLDLAGAVPGQVLRRAVRQAEIDGLVDLAALDARLRTESGRKGLRALRNIIGFGPARTRSELEDRTLELLRRHGFPDPSTNAMVQTPERTYEVDFLFPEQRVIIEADGDRYHGTRLAREQDAAKQAALEEAGYRVIRVTWAHITRDTAQTARRLGRVLARRCT